MVTLDKIAHLAMGGCFDSIGQGVRPLHMPMGPQVEGLEEKKLEVLGIGTRYDICHPSSTRDEFDNFKMGICHSFTHDGRCVSLFKTLFTESCSLTNATTV